MFFFTNFLIKLSKSIDSNDENIELNKEDKIKHNLEYQKDDDSLLKEFVEIEDFFDNPKCPFKNYSKLNLEYYNYFKNEFF
jgi:hypothetical protein